ncbi:MAG: S46 family peptidase [Myxococcales bacterium]|nr:S46 family peptidase [Myxococcales bacterium]
MKAIHTLGAIGVVASFVCAHVAHSEEGMWLPEQLPERSEELRTLGIEMDPADLADVTRAPLSSIASLGGCSASFVSPNGLIVTNHHCVVGYLQHNSTAENNLVDVGYYAQELEDELYAGPGSRVYVTESITDVTDTIEAALAGAEDDRARFQASELATHGLVAECEADGIHHCQVASYYGGAEYRLFRQLEIKDLRIVYAPPNSVGNFGDEIDNWMWPRHSGDFAFLRAYVGPDGAPADFSEENVPYNPPAHLDISAAGVSEGDFVMVAGFPGRTQRLSTAAQFRYAEEDFPWAVSTMDDLIGILDDVSAVDPEAGVLLSATRFGIANYRKKYEGMIDGFRASSVARTASERENAMLEWLAAEEDRASDLDAVNELFELEEGARVFSTTDRFMGWSMWTVQLLGAGHRLYHLSVERQKPDEERQEGYQDRDLPQFRASMERMDRRYVREADERILAYFLAHLDDLDDGELSPFRELLTRFDGDAGAAAAFVYGNTQLDDLETRLGLMDVAPEAFESSDDAMIQLAVALHPVTETLRERRETLSGARTRLVPHYVLAMNRMLGGDLYPDANGTLRVTYGQVQGYSPRDAVSYAPQTTVQGILEKHTGEFPFNAPQRLLDAIVAGDFGGYADSALGAMPVDFLSTLDITNGNSGSVTLNARGEACGLAFDGNYEAMASDWLFDPVSTRSIHVDIRYVLWWLDTIDGASRILDELTIVR